jgi:16S rRNA (guanine527-N7)-methyltransferase
VITAPQQAALRDLGARHGLAPDQTESLAALVSALASDARAPTALRSPDRSIDGHIADSLAALEVEAVRAASAIADLGSGAGFPGLPLAIALADCEVWLLESQARKCAYMQDLIAQAHVSRARVVCGRVEDWGEGRATVDVALARALAPQPVVLEYAAPLLRRGGVLVDWRGRRDQAQERSAELAAGELGLERVEVRRVAPFPEARDRHLHLYMKVSDTPPQFPRRPGMAAKRPLGTSIHRA